MRTRRTNAELERLDGQILTILGGDHPQSVRHLFYRLVSAGHLEKTEHGYRTVVRRCTALRRSGRLPYGWISDATRRGFHVVTFLDGAELIERYAGLYRADLWSLADAYVEVWCESRSIAGVVQADCEALGVSLYPAGGFTSLTLAHQSAEYIRQAADGRPVKIVYIGDYDPAGLLIDGAVLRELRQHLPDLDIQERRVAITADQIKHYGLPTRPRKVGDRRRKDITMTVEAEALRAAELRRLLRAEVESYLPAGALARVQAVEEAEREQLWELVKAIEEKGSVSATVEALRAD